MFSTLSAALLLATSPATANSSEAPAQEFEVKKVCKTVREVGSLIPQRTCQMKRVPVKKPENEGSKSETATTAAPQTLLP